MKLIDMRGATLEELTEREKELKREMFNLRFQQAIGGRVSWTGYPHRW